MIPPVYSIILLVLFTQFFDPFRRDVLEGNVNQLQLGLITLILWLRLNKNKKQNNFLSGLILGLLFMLKPNLALIFIFLFINELILTSAKYLLYSAAGIPTGVVLGFSLPLLFFGKTCGWIQWLIHFPKIALVDIYMKTSFIYIFFGIKRLIYYYLLMFILILLPFFIIFMASLVSKIYEIRKINIFTADKTIFIFDILMITLGASVYLLSSPLVHFHYFILIVPSILLILAPGNKLKSLLSKDNLIRILFAIILISLFNIRTYHEGYEAIAIYRTYWPFAYVAVILIYGYSILQLMHLYKNGQIRFNKQRNEGLV